MADVADSPLLENGERVAEGIAATIERYVLDGTDDDLKRLLKISDVSAKFARDVSRVWWKKENGVTSC